MENFDPLLFAIGFLGGFVGFFIIEALISRR